ncbi:MAG: group II intron reverse transcriptase/maturase [Sedimenticola sp.]
MSSYVQALQDKLSHAAKQSLDRRFGALYDKLYRRDVLREAWFRVEANRGAPGIDEQSFDYIEEEIGGEAFLDEIEQELRSKTYRPLPVKRCWIEKPGKPEKRPLGIPVIKDRLIQMAAKLVIEPIFETNFLPCSYGFRPERDAPMAIREIQRIITFRGRTTVVDADIRSCFDRIPQEPLMNLVKRRISDPRMIKLIKGWLEAGVMDDGAYIEPDGLGTPQGSVISPLLANIYLHSFDKMWQQSRLPGTLIRYADDFVILLHPKTDAEWILTEIRRMMGRLGLELHPEKTRVTKAKEGFDFLGVHLRLCRVRKPKAKIKNSCRIWPSDCSMQRIRQKVRDVIGRRYSKELEEMIKELNPKLRGWANYHIRARGERKRMKKLNGFVRERLRIFLKRKYSDEVRGSRRLHGNLLSRLGLYQFA